jgi:hypothetical protein
VSRVPGRQMAALTCCTIVLVAGASCGRQRPAMDKGSTVASVSAGAKQKEVPKRPAAALPPGDFRTAHWGDSKAAVKELEDAKLTAEAPDGLAYAGKVAGLDAGIVYQFVDDKLVAGGYVIEGKHANANIFIDECNELRALLREKYGKPTSDKMVWRDDLYKNDPSNWGIAVGSGRLSYFTEWQTPETKINLALSGDNFKINFVLRYGSKKYQGLFEATDKKRKLREL